MGRSDRSHGAPRARRLLVAVVAAGMLLSLAAGEAGAQEGPGFQTPEGSAPRWTWAWSPLERIGELPRGLASEQLISADLLTHPAPRIGSFWTAGNPGGLAHEIGDAFATFSLGYDDIEGSYGRPLDAGAESRLLCNATGWGALGERGAGIGRVLVDRGTFENGAFANVLQPYTTEPYAVMDTIGDPVIRTAVQLEGAGGWALGRLGLGLGLGYAQQETRTIESAVPRLYRSATPAVSGGASFTFGDDLVSVAAHGRWQRTAENVSILSVAAASRVYELQGYDEPVPINLAATLYDRRFEREAWSAGGSLKATRRGVAWVAYAQSERISSLNFSATVGEGPVDRWKADGWSAGAAAQARFGDPAWLATVAGSYTTLSGEAQHSGIQGVPFAADEKSYGIAVELRMPRMSGWEARLRMGVTRDERNRRDNLAEVGLDIRAWRPTGGVEVARWFGGALALAFAAAMAEHNPSGSIPNPAALGPIYNNWVAPELALEASEGRSFAGAGTLRWQATGGTAFWLQMRYETLEGPGDVAMLEYAPRGDRGGWKVALGASVGM